jgi:hypothetical protein
MTDLIRQSFNENNQTLCVLGVSAVSIFLHG